MNNDRRSILLAEYQQAQASGEHHNSISWTAAGVTWAATIALQSAAAKFFQNGILLPDHPIPLLELSVVGLFILLFEFFLNRRLNAVIFQKYDRCKAIETELGMFLHRMHPRKFSKIVHVSYWFLPSLFSACWTAILALSVVAIIKGRL